MSLTAFRKTLKPQSTFECCFVSQSILQCLVWIFHLNLDSVWKCWSCQCMPAWLSLLFVYSLEISVYSQVYRGQNFLGPLVKQTIQWDLNNTNLTNNVKSKLHHIMSTDVVVSGYVLYSNIIKNISLNLIKTDNSWKCTTNAWSGLHFLSHLILLLLFPSSGLVSFP